MSLSGREVIDMFLSELVDEIKVLKIDIADSKVDKAKTLIKCDEIIHNIRDLQKVLRDEYCYFCGHTVEQHQKIPGGLVIDCRMILEDITAKSKFRIIGICGCKKFVSRTEALSYNWAMVPKKST
jgi:hypothetical protein